MDEEGRVQALRSAVEDVLEELAPVARKLDCDQELSRVDGIVQGGPSSARQRTAAAEHGGDLRSVVALLVDEMATDVPGGAPA